MTFATIIDELRKWLNTLPPDFGFLLALPFVIAIAAFIQDAMGRQTQRTGSVLRESYRRFVLGVRVTTRQWLSRTLVPAGMPPARFGGGAGSYRIGAIKDVRSRRAAEGRAASMASVHDRRSGTDGGEASPK